VIEFKDDQLKIKEEWVMRTVKILVLSLFILTTSLGVGLTAAEQEWPTRPIELYIGLPPGGSNDIMARIRAPYMSKELGVPVVVVNKAGATGGVCMEYIANAKPDGYTIMEHSLANLAMQPITLHATFTIRDFTYILGHTGFSHAFIVKKDAPWKDFREWVEYVRKNPGIKFGTHGPTSNPHNIMVWIAKRENLKVLYATFNGDADTVPALLGGHIDIAMGLGGQASFIEGGKLRTILQLTGEPVDTTKVQSLEEVYPDFPISLKLMKEAPIGLFGPKGIPAPIVQKLNKALKKGIYSEEYTRYLKQNNRKLVIWEGEEVISKLEMATEGFAVFLKEIGFEKK
jgi:tripartite-type tricarboxylate transporter receptor subunit TctC